MGKPGFYFYTGDWVKDTSCLTLDCQGAYFRWLIGPLLENQGTMTWPVSAWASYVGTTAEIASSFLHQLEVTKVANVEWQNDGKGMANGIAKLSNRRMMREAQNRESTRAVRSEVGKKGAQSRWQRHGKKCPSSSSSSSSLNHKKNHKNDSLPKTPRKIATSFPTDFVLSESLKVWLSEQRCPDAASQLEAFRDHHVSKGSRFIDWDAAFRTWIRKSVIFGTRSGGGNLAQLYATPSRTTEEILAELQAKKKAVVR